MCEQQNTQTVPNFGFDFSDTSWAAVGYDSPWNGWVTPVVTRESLEKFVNWVKADEEMMELMEYPVEWHGDTLHMEGIEISPDSHGNYHLSSLGYIFCTTDHS